MKNMKQPSKKWVRKRYINANYKMFKFSTEFVKQQISLSLRVLAEQAL